MSIDINVYRFSDNGNSTMGLVFIDGEFFCYCLEDEHRDVKVKGETRIPAGTYQLGIKSELTPMTRRYRDQYGWFKYHLNVKDVPEFDDIYIHKGNTEKHTAGCLLLGNQPNNNTIKAGFLGDSGTIYKAFYQKVYDAAKEGDCMIYYSDESFFIPG